ncbi:hypothetical protein M404DRAFT_618449 [Pisolithus tinctorius Marx 270]|uniref:Uncharacterized protein n=1 Tax=Pisolithus tinctorius Marx 270 TaxID=870435 RepID=A0A0C3P729_PISTI|nr:hypothetical protein M404DRAFT_618449 [Pisolithus tinctorius Marx 270]
MPTVGRGPLTSTAEISASYTHTSTSIGPLTDLRLPTHLNPFDARDTLRMLWHNGPFDFRPIAGAVQVCARVTSLLPIALSLPLASLAILSTFYTNGLNCNLGTSKALLTLATHSSQVVKLYAAAFPFDLCSKHNPNVPPMMLASRWLKNTVVQRRPGH